LDDNSGTSFNARRLFMAADAGPPFFLMALGLVLWLAVTATVAGISIQTVGKILVVVGAIWLVVELIQARTLARRGVVEEPVYRDRV
jgi:tetrahydromethanopterin S-methyltransferase subunit E